MYAQSFPLVTNREVQAFSQSLWTAGSKHSMLAAAGLIAKRLGQRRGFIYLITLPLAVGVYCAAPLRCYR